MQFLVHKSGGAYYLIELISVYLPTTCILLFVAQPHSLALYWAFNEYLFYLGDIVAHYHDTGKWRLNCVAGEFTLHQPQDQVLHSQRLFPLSHLTGFSCVTGCVFLLVNIFGLESSALLKLVN